MGALAILEEFYTAFRWRDVPGAESTVSEKAAVGLTVGTLMGLLWPVIVRRWRGPL
jgi:hypothetical protein